MMTTPDRDAISLSRLFRYHIVANGSPGAIHDPTGRMVPDLKTNPSSGIVTGTMHLDALCKSILHLPFMHPFGIPIETAGLRVCCV